MQITKQLAKYSIPPTIFFSIVIVLIYLHGLSYEDATFEVTQYFLNYPFSHTYDNQEEDISLGISNSEPDDKIEMQWHDASLFNRDPLSLVSINPKEKKAYLSNVIKNFLAQGNMKFGYYFGPYNIKEMEYEPFLQDIQITHDNIFLTYHYLDSHYILTFWIDSQSNLELQKISFKLPYIGIDGKKAYFSLEINKEQFMALEVLDSFGSETQKSVDYMKKTIGEFNTFNHFVENIGVDSETEKLFENIHTTLK